MKHTNLLFLTLIATFINATVPLTNNNIKLNTRKNHFDQNLTKLCLSLKCQIDMKGIAIKGLRDNKSKDLQQ